MAIQIKSIDTAANKFVSRGQSAGADYTAGVNSPRRPWASTTAASAQNWAAGVSQASANGSFAKGVNKAGDAKWQRKAAGVGSTRFGPGIAAAKSDYVAGFQPYHDVLAGLTLPPRGPKGDPNNNSRVAAVDQALRQKKLSG